jgi:MSHA biogenesis protein MshE
MSAAAKPKQLRIGDLLIDNNVITMEQLNVALKNQKITGLKLGQQLIEDGCLTSQQMNAFLARQLNVPYIDLREFDINPDIVQRIPEIYARRCRVVALGVGRDKQLMVGMADPTNIYAYDEITRLLGEPFRMAVVDEPLAMEVIDKVYRKSADMGGIAAELEETVTVEARDEKSDVVIEDNVSDAPVVRFLNTMFEDAVQVGASDIHIEPAEKNVIIRLRQDGVLHVQVKADKRIGTPLISKLKLLAGLDISEKRLPQDGRFRMQVKSTRIDVRLSTIPVHGGQESAVMRILNQSNELLNLDASGMSPPTLKRFRNMIHSPNGVILVTGPTGSGKTTTLYGALAELNKPEVKIVTAEDPVEYQLPGIVQVQINQKIGLDFAQVLRSFLRQDPDIILVGEMRDQETVQTAMRAAMTGHLVLSTMHTNSAVSTPLRLLDMGVEPFLISAALQGVLAQRLVRRICDRCKVPYELQAGERELLTAQIGAERLAKLQFQHGRGCSHCNNTGYRGRVAIHELLAMTSTLTRLLTDGDLSGFERAARTQQGFKSLYVSALELAARGITTLEQVLEIAYAGDD